MYWDMCESAIAKLFQCLDENLMEPVGWWPESEFEERVMARWAVYEIINAIIEHPSTEPYSVVEKFMVDMMDRACMARTPEQERIYTIAVNTAEDVLTII